MAGEWKEQPLESCIAALIDYRGKTPKKTSFGVPLITAKVVKNGRIETPDEFISDEDYEPWMRRGIPRAGDVLITTEAPLGEVAQLGPERVALAQRLIALRGKPDVLHNTFLKFLLQSDGLQKQLRARASGSTVSGIKQSELRKVSLTLPPYPEQRAIAHILGTLEDKIELNRRRNQTLEAMARALFKDWFVDFGPVRAKMEGREPYLPIDLWQLFPDRLNDEGKPEGWDSGRLDDALILQRGFDLPASDRIYGPYPVMAASGINGYHDKFMAKGPGITTGRSGVLGRVFFVHTDFWPLNTSLWVKEFKRVTPLYAFELLRGLGFEVFNAGSAVPTLNRNHVHNLPIILPPKQLIEAFDRQVTPMRQAQKKNEDECQSLAQLRDTLLPKLISGELRIADAKNFKEGAGS